MPRVMAKFSVLEVALVEAKPTHSLERRRPFFSSLRFLFASPSAFRRVKHMRRYVPRTTWEKKMHQGENWNAT